MAPEPPYQPAAADNTWRIDPSVLACRFGYELVAYHLRTKRSYRLPSLPIPVRDLIERGGEFEIDASRSTPPSLDDDQLEVELRELLEMLEREQLIRRTEGGHVGASQHSRNSDPHRTAGSNGEEVSGGDVAPPSLYASTALQRAPKVDIVIQGGQTRLYLASKRERAISGGAHALRLLDVFARPRTVQEVVRVVQRRVQDVHGWIGLVESLVHLYEGGILQAMPQGANGRREERVARTLSSSGPRRTDPA